MEGERGSEASAAIYGNKKGIPDIVLPMNIEWAWAGKRLVLWLVSGDEMFSGGRNK